MRGCCRSSRRHPQRLRLTPFDGFFGPKFHILTPRWLPTISAPLQADSAAYENQRRIAALKRAAELKLARPASAGLSWISRSKPMSFALDTAIANAAQKILDVKSEKRRAADLRQLADHEIADQPEARAARGRPARSKRRAPDRMSFAEPPPSRRSATRPAEARKLPPRRNYVRSERSHRARCRVAWWITERSR